MSLYGTNNGRFGYQNSLRFGTAGAFNNGFFAPVPGFNNGINPLFGSIGSRSGSQRARYGFNFGNPLGFGGLGGIGGLGLPIAGGLGFGGGMFGIGFAIGSAIGGLIAGIANKGHDCNACSAGNNEMAKDYSNNGFSIGIS